MSSTGVTIPRPKKLAHHLLTAALAKNGLLADVAHAAKTGRNAVLPVTGASAPRRYCAFTVLPLVSGMTIAPGGAFSPAALAALPLSGPPSWIPGITPALASFLEALSLWTWPKNAATPQKSV